jgi:hypothetical protein
MHFAVTPLHCDQFRHSLIAGCLLEGKKPSPVWRNNRRCSSGRGICSRRLGGKRQHRGSIAAISVRRQGRKGNVRCINLTAPDSVPPKITDAADDYPRV